ncbi:MAG: PAS domain-containing protein [Methanoregula sp.]|nr:PAS domain-containing protein [Methanoregula sp.]
MTTRDKSPQINRSFSYYLLIFMVVLVICIVGILTVSEYLDTYDNFNRESHNHEVQTEKNVEEAIRLADMATTILDNSLNDRMREGLLGINAEYERSGHDPSRMDLATIQEQLGEGYDIYVIDENGVIVSTTYPPELGLDFRTIPYFYSYLTKIRSSEGFFPDRVVHEFLGSGQYRKYAYMPTADHQYILELGLGGPAFDKINRVLDNHDNIRNIVMANPYAESYAVFTTMGRYAGNNTRPGEPVGRYLQQVISTHCNLEITDPRNSTAYHFLYVNLVDDRYGSDPSRVVMIEYNTQLIDEALNRLIFYHVLVAAAAIVIGCVLAFFFSRRMALPIQAIVADVDIIARGNLTHRIGKTRNREFTILEESINTMVDSLKSASRKTKDDEHFQQEMIDQLPVAIFIKRADNGRYVYWNTESEQLYQIPASRVIGRTDSDLFSEEVAATFQMENRELFLNRSEVRNKIISNRHLGGRIIHMIIVPVFDSDGTPQYVLGISEDVSSQNINLKLDLLFSITRHDILDNLSVIMSHLERAQLKNTHDEMQQFLDKTIGSIESIRNQIVYMRHLQELGIISPKWQNVGQAFDDAVRLLPEHPAEIHTGVDNVEIFADPLLPRIFFNILENSLRNSRQDPHEISFTVRQENDDLLLIYTDNGYSVPGNEKERIFDAGYDQGTVRGMFLIRELLGFTGVTIRETGICGEGVRFEIRVPAGKFRFTGTYPGLLKEP